MNTPEEVFKDACWSNSQPFQPDLKLGKVIKVYDGDSITIAAKPYENYPIYRFSVRLSGIDTPELRTRDELEKKYGYEVRDKLRDKILDKVVTVKCGDFDKYGRLLIDIYCDNETRSVSNWLIENKYAFAYNGGTKQKWSDFLRK